MPYSHWNLRLGHFICQIRKPGLWTGSSLVGQWLRLCASPEGCSSPDRGTKIPHAPVMWPKIISTHCLVAGLHVLMGQRYPINKDRCSV